MIRLSPKREKTFRRWWSGGVVLAYALAVAVFALWPCHDYDLSWPAAVLAVGAAVVLPWETAAAFLLCALGDAAGQAHDFILQMGLFAAAHALLILYFLRHRRAWAGRRLTMVLALVALGLMAWSMAVIVPHVAGEAVGAGVAGYSLLIIVMAYEACRQQSALTALGAAMFLLSDGVLGYNMFVHSVGAHDIIIMSAYYAALLLLFLGFLRLEAMDRPAERMLLKRATRAACARVLHRERCSLVVGKGRRLYMFYKRGVRDLEETLTAWPALLEGAVVADKVTGKAAAAYVAHGRVKELHSDVLSEKAVPLLKAAGVSYDYDQLVASIVIPKGDKRCPLEQIVAPATTADEAISLLTRHFQEMQRCPK